MQDAHCTAQRDKFKVRAVAEAVRTLQVADSRAQELYLKLKKSSGK